MSRPLRPTAFAFLALLLAAALPMPVSEATHSNPGFDSCDFTGWTLWQNPSPPITSAPSGSSGAITWTREVAPAYAHDGACGLKMRCVAQLPNYQDYCHLGVTKSIAPATEFGMWVRLPEATADGYGADLWIRAKDASGAVYYVIDPSMPTANCDSSGNPKPGTGPGLKCKTLPLGVWTHVCLDIPSFYFATHGRAIGPSYELLMLVDAHTRPAEAWIDTTTHSCDRDDDGGGCEQACPPPPTAPCRGDNLTTGKGSYAFVGGGYGNAASGDFSTVAGGFANHAAGLMSTIPGGGCNRALGPAATVGGGENNLAAVGHGTVAGGLENEAATPFSSVPGGKDALTRSYGQLAQASGNFSAPGDAQRGEYVLRGVSGRASDLPLRLDGISQSIVVPPGASFAFSGLVVARSPGGDSAGWEIAGVVENVGGVTSVIGTTVVGASIGADPATLGWSVRAEGSAGTLQILATGAQGVRWVATLETAELVFA